MREWLRLGHARSRFQCSPRTGADDDIRSAEAANSSVKESDFQSLRAYEAPRSQDEFRSGLLVVVEVYIIQARYHRAFSGAYRRHVNMEAVCDETEFFASTKVRRYPRTVENVLTR
jgi:hypothetical protein